MSSHDVATIVCAVVIVLGQIAQTWIGHQRGKQVDTNVQTLTDKVDNVNANVSTVRAIVNGGPPKG